MKKPDTKTKKEIEKILAKFEPDHAQRLRELFSLWKNPKASKTLPQWQVKELIRAGLVRDTSGTEADTGPSDVPKFCSGSELSRILSRLFNVAVSPVQIHRAAFEGMVGKAANGSWETAVAIGWWRKNRIEKGETFLALQAQADEAELQKRIDDARRSKILADDAEREASEKYILREVAAQTIIVALKTHHSFVKKGLAKFKTEPVEILKRVGGFSDEQLQRVSDANAEAFKNFIAAVEDDCERASKSSAP